VSELGELLELLYGARDRYGTVRVVLWQWRNERLAADAFERLVPDAPRGGSRVYSIRVDPLGDDDGSFPEQTEDEVRVWLAGPKRYRSESSGGHVSVRDGATLWSIHEGFGAVEQEAEGTTESWEPLLDPGRLLGALHLRRAGEARAAGRAAIRVSATPRSRHDHALHTLGFFGADEVELLVDAEVGVVLRVEARGEGAPFAVWDVREIAFDESIPDDLLRLEPPAGERFKSPREIEPQERLTIEDAVARASFGVWIPPELPGDWRLQALCPPPGGRRPETLTLVYTRADATHHLVVQESGEPLRWSAHAEPEFVERGDRQLRVIRREERHPTALVFDDRDGTQIALQSIDLELELLLDLAVSLVPAP
jgi:outer membrane lipoprotein-sorting protein